MPNDTFLKILQKGPFKMNMAKTIILSLGRVLQILHSQNVAHCDIKPENILVAADWQLKLCDFGFARFVNEFQSPPGGTPGYTAPELYEGKLVDLKKADMFALGVVFFIVVVGFPPFQNNGPNKDGWWNLIANRQWDYFWGKCQQFRNEEFEDLFKQIIMRLLEADPNKRMNVQEFVENQYLNQDACSEQEVLLEIQRRVNNIKQQQK